MPYKEDTLKQTSGGGHNTGLCSLGSGSLDGPDSTGKCQAVMCMVRRPGGRDRVNKGRYRGPRQRVRGDPGCPVPGGCCKNSAVILKDTRATDSSELRRHVT